MTVSSSRLRGGLLGRLGRARVGSGGVGLVLLEGGRSRGDLPQFSESPTFRLCRTSFLRAGAGDPLLQGSPGWFPVLLRRRVARRWSS